MRAVRTIYAALGRVEEAVVVVSITLITFLIFTGAVTRLFGYPLNWATDLSLLLFAWVVFLGADLAFRSAEFIRIDMLVTKLPPKVQKVLYYLFSLMAIAFFGLMVVYGIPLAIDNSKRLFQTLGISYSWATMSAPLGSLLLIFSIIMRMIDNWNEAVIDTAGKEAI